MGGVTDTPAVVAENTSSNNNNSNSNSNISNGTTGPAGNGTTSDHTGSNGVTENGVHGNQPIKVLGFENQYHLQQGDVVRLMTQTLHSLGYTQTAQLLQKESQITLQSPIASQFREHVFQGRWEQVLAALPQLKLAGDVSLDEAKFLVLRQQYLEHLQAGETAEALQVLRGDMAALQGIDPSRIHSLTSCMMSRDLADLTVKTDGWDGKEGKSRGLLLVALQKFLSPSEFIPENRLLHLLDQAIGYQKTRCYYHNTIVDSISLFEDHLCTQDEIPRETRQLLELHTDEVWFVKFSHCGRYLASASADCTCIIWDVACDNPEPRVVLRGHRKAVSFLDWSPNDEFIITCGNDHHAKVWDTKTGMCVRDISRHKDTVTTAAWLPSSREFVTASLDRNIYLWDMDKLDDEPVRTWAGTRTNDLAITSDGQTMVSICTEKKILLYSVTSSAKDSIIEDECITSLQLASDDRHLLVSLASQEIHIWDIVDKKLVQKYRGHKQGRFVVRADFGGSRENFIVSGSEDSQVYIWHRKEGSLLEVLNGHSGTVNSVSWSPRFPHLLASGSDDQTIRLWTANCLEPSCPSCRWGRQGGRGSAGDKGKGKSTGTNTSTGASSSRGARRVELGGVVN